MVDIPTIRFRNSDDHISSLQFTLLYFNGEQVGNRLVVKEETETISANGRCSWWGGGERFLLKESSQD